MTTRELAAALVTAVRGESGFVGSTADQYDREVTALLLALKDSGHWLCRVELGPHHGIVSQVRLPMD